MTPDPLVHPLPRGNPVYRVRPALMAPLDRPVPLAIVHLAVNLVQLGHLVPPEILLQVPQELMVLLVRLVLQAVLEPNFPQEVSDHRVHLALRETRVQLEIKDPETVLEVMADQDLKAHLVPPEYPVHQAMKETVDHADLKAPKVLRDPLVLPVCLETLGHLELQEIRGHQDNSSPRDPLVLLVTLAILVIRVIREQPAPTARLECLEAMDPLVIMEPQDQTEIRELLDHPAQRPPRPRVLLAFLDLRVFLDHPAKMWLDPPAHQDLTGIKAMKAHVDLSVIAVVMVILVSLDRRAQLVTLAEP